MSQKPQGLYDLGSKPTSLLDLPPEVLLDHLLPSLRDREVATLSATCRAFHQVCMKYQHRPTLINKNDDTFWLERTRTTFSYNPSQLAPAPSRNNNDQTAMSWNKRLYIGLSNPRPFIWGTKENGRQGELRSVGPREPSHMGRSGVFRPNDISGHFERKRNYLREDALVIGPDGNGVSGSGETADGSKGIVELQAGGWSYAARDTEGTIWVWGQLDGTNPYFNNVGRFALIREPKPISLPCRVEAMSVGRNHILLLDQDNLIWELQSWFEAYHHTAPTLTSPANHGSTRRPHHIVQISAGWRHSACLTSSGRIIAWLPFSQLYKESLTPSAQLSGPDHSLNSQDSRVNAKWGTIGDITFELDPIPSRPTWDSDAFPNDSTSTRSRQSIEDEWRRFDEEAQWMLAGKKEELERIIKIASGIDFLIALKGNGEVWYIRIQETGQHSQWEYLPYFSSPTVSHISAQFTSLTSYSTTSSSRVNHARMPAELTPHWGQTFMPNDLSVLQGRNVIQVAIGDYHFAALTADGEVWSWGEGEKGQLGLGIDLRQTDEPRRVSFLSEGRETDPDKQEEEEPFVFAITAAGWHTGALVLGDTRKKRRPAQREDITGGSLSGTKWTPRPPAPSAGSRPPRSIPGGSATGRMVYPNPAPSNNLSQIGFTQPPGRPMFRVGLAGAMATPTSPATAPAPPARHWVKRVSDGVRSYLGGATSDASAENGSSASGSGSAIASMTVDQSADDPVSESTLIRADDEGDGTLAAHAPVTDQDQPRPLREVSYAEAGSQDVRQASAGGSIPAYARGQGQDRRVPDLSKFQQ